MHHSVYYYHQNHPFNSYELSNQELNTKINEIWLDSNKIYGAPKIREELKKQGYTVSLKRTQRQMNKLHIKSILLKNLNHHHLKVATITLFIFSVSSEICSSREYCDTGKSETFTVIYSRESRDCLRVLLA